MTQWNYLPDIVTFPYVDESLHVRDLAYISEKYPLVEWCVHYYPEKQGTPGYPKKQWIQNLLKYDVNVSVEISGKVIYEIILDKSRVNKFMDSLCRFSRVKINIPYKDSFFDSESLIHIYETFYHSGIETILTASDAVDEITLSWMMLREDFSLLVDIRKNKPPQYKWKMPNFVNRNKFDQIGFLGDFHSEQIIFDIYELMQELQNRNIERYWLCLGDKLHDGKGYRLDEVKNILSKIYDD